MDGLFSKIKKVTESSTDGDKPEKQEGQHEPASTGDLLSSAKVVAEAARSQFSNEGDKVDKAKVAGAAEDLLDATSKYGKLEDNQYVGKAKDYLHNFHSPATTTGPGPQSTPQDTTESAPKPSGGESGDDESGAGVGDYLKSAQGFLKKE